MTMSRVANALVASGDRIGFATVILSAVYLEILHLGNAD